MTLPPESIEVDRCYLTKTGHVRRVVRMMPDRRVQYEQRPGHLVNAGAWKPGMQSDRMFADLVEREVPCDWRPEGDG